VPTYKSTGTLVRTPDYDDAAFSTNGAVTFTPQVDFTVAAYAAAHGLDLATAQRVIDAAIAAGWVVQTS
jgi:hypothetical protein